MLSGNSFPIALNAICEFVLDSIATIREER